jgi:hypothetical protein
MNYLEFHDACDEISGDFEYMASVVLEHVEELGELGALVDVFYLERVEVAPNLLGHRWGVRVAANLLQAISVDNLDRLIVAFAGMNEDPQDSPNRLAAQRILTDLGMEVLDGTDLYVAHPSVAGVADAIAGWLDVPGLMSPEMPTPDDHTRGLQDLAGRDLTLDPAALHQAAVDHWRSDAVPKETCKRCGREIFESGGWKHLADDGARVRGCRAATYNPVKRAWDDAIPRSWLAAPDR